MEGLYGVFGGRPIQANATGQILVAEVMADSAIIHRLADSSADLPLIQSITESDTDLLLRFNNVGNGLKINSDAMVNNQYVARLDIMSLVTRRSRLAIS